MDPTQEQTTQRSRLVPLVGRQGNVLEQWIFPELTFTCNGTLGGWRFLGERRAFADTRCRVHLTTWREDAVASGARYRRVSTSNQNPVRIRTINSLVTYEFATPVQVRAGDIFGVEVDSSCGTFNNILARDTRDSERSSISYRRLTIGTAFTINSQLTVRESNLIPVAEPILGKRLN